METLNNTTVKVGLKIRNINNPEWGIFTIEQINGIWGFKNNRGGGVLDPGEFSKWEILA